MKGWCKILRLEKYDVLVQRLVTKEDGENVKITIRMPEGQFIKTASLGDGEEAEKEAIKLYKSYTKVQAQKFLEELEKLIEENEKEDNNNKG
jgi:uncharacterized protein with PIN domain